MAGLSTNREPSLNVMTFFAGLRSTVVPLGSRKICFAGLSMSDAPFEYRAMYFAGFSVVSRSPSSGSSAVVPFIETLIGTPRSGRPLITSRVLPASIDSGSSNTVDTVYEFSADRLDCRGGSGLRTKRCVRRSDKRPRSYHWRLRSLLRQSLH